MHAEHWINHGELGWSSESFNSEQLQVISLSLIVKWPLIRFTKSRVNTKQFIAFKSQAYSQITLALLMAMLSTLALESPFNWINRIVERLRKAEWFHMISLVFVGWLRLQFNLLKIQETSPTCSGSPYVIRGSISNCTGGAARGNLFNS